MPIFRFWRKSIPELMKDYLLLRSKTETARDFYTSIAINDRENRFEAFRKWLELFVETNRYMIEVVKKFSPKVARGLEVQITSFSETTEDLLKEESLESTKYAIFTEEQRNKVIKENLDNAMKYGDIHEKEVNIVFIAVFDTLMRIKGELPLEPEDKIKIALAEYNPRLAKIYEGAYRALESDNPDRYRHCSASMRKLVDDFLGKTAEEIREFIASHTKSKRESEILNSLYRLVKSIDRAWNKGDHEDIQSETAILAIQATELMISHIFHLYEK